MTSSALVLFFALGCSSTLPVPEATQHPLAAYVEIPYPPPAALAETVPPQPERAGVVWIDGEWLPRRKEFVWRRGGWVVPPPQSKFAPWRSWYRRDGRLMMAPGTWYDVHHERLRAPQPIEAALTPLNQRTPESQTGR